MPDAIMESVLGRIDEYLREFPEEHVSFIWHGGEATLLPPRYYERVLEIQSRLCAQTKQRIFYSIQSNLTAMTQGHLDVFRRMGINHISTSYDPIPGIRGRRTRQGIDSESYNKVFLKNLGLLERNGFSWSIIYVVHRGSLERPRDIYRFLLNISGGRLMINPVDIFGDDLYGLRITPEEYADFLGAIFAVWWPERLRYPGIKPFAYYSETVLNSRHPMLCSDSGRCTRSHLYIGPDGSTSLCCLAADFKLASFGNIQKRSIVDMFRDSARSQMRVRNDILPQTECRGCRFWGLCHGGCPMRAYARYQDFSRKSDWCAYRKRFLEKYFEPLTGVRYVDRTKQQSVI